MSPIGIMRSTAATSEQTAGIPSPSDVQQLVEDGNFEVAIPVLHLK